MQDRPRWKRPGVVEMLATTAIPIVGIVGFGWSGIHILLLYWFENSVVGVFSLLRLVLTRPIYEHRADYLRAHPWLLQHYPMSAEDWATARTLPVKRSGSYKEFFVPLFLGHYTFFLWIHAFLIATLVAKLPGREWWKLFENEWSAGLGFAIASIAVTHGWRFWTEDLQGRRYTRSCPFLTMVYPYRRLLVLQVALLLGGLAIIHFALPAALAILLILVKAAFDMNWIRIPLGPKKIDWKDFAAREEKRASGSIIGKTITEQPRDSHASLVESGTTLRIDLQPRGVREVWHRMRAGGCLFIALLFLGVVSGFGFAFFTQQWRLIMEGGDGHYWLMLLLMTCAQIGGTLWLLMLSATISVPWSVFAYGTVRGSIELEDGLLDVQQKGYPMGRTGSFKAADVVDLGMSPTGSKTNGFAVLELRIRLRDGTECTFFTGRDADELNWIATRLTMRLAE